MAYTDFPYLNQLQFNLDVPLKSKNLVIHHQRLQPTVIDRSRHRQWNQDGLQTSQTSFTHPAASEDRMAWAVQMAKRDLKNNTVNVKHGAISRTTSPKTKARNSNSQRQSKLQEKKKFVNVRDRPVKPHVQLQSPKPFLNTRAVSHLPATTNSPPTRDTDVYPRHKSRMDLQPSGDVERLQLEIEGYLDQIRSMEEKALLDPDFAVAHRSRTRRREGYLDEEVNENRLVMRAEEYTARSARTLYTLRQQVRQIQRDLLTSGVDSKVKHTKKSATVFRLSTAHRGAARAIQAFVSNLPHQDLRSGLPSSYTELSLLIRQLTQLSSQVNHGEDSQIQKDLTNMLDQVDDLNDAWESEIRQRRQIHCRSPRQRLPGDRQRRDGGKVFKGRGRLIGKENKPTGVLKKAVRAPRDFPSGPSHLTTVHRSATRRAALRAGVAALVGDLEPRDLQTSSKSGEPHDLQILTKPGVTWNISPRSKPRGILLPANLQDKREKFPRPQSRASPTSHFADPTIAANMKAVLPLQNPVLCGTRPRSPTVAPPQPVRRSRSFSPSRLGSRQPWRPPGTPTKSPRSPSHRSRSLSPAGTRMTFFVEDVDKDIVKQLFPDDEQQTMQRAHSRKSPTRNRSPSASRRREPLRNSFVSSVVEEAKRRMKPYLKTGSASYPGYQHGHRRREPSPDTSSSQTDLVSSGILDDILTKTVSDLHGMERQEVVHSKAKAMQATPTLEVMLQRLEEMEQEQLDIRQRWTSLTYDDPMPVSKYLSKREVLSDRPCSPPALEIQRMDISTREQSSRQPPSQPQQPGQVSFPQEADNEGLVFTRERKEARWTETTLPDSRRPRTMLSIPQSVVGQIVDSQETYDRYLKKMSHHPHGVFQPWTLVEKISDEILSECMSDVARELDDMNDAIANHLYKSEFMEAKDQSEAPVGGATRPGQSDTQGVSRPPVGVSFKGNNSAVKEERSYPGSDEWQTEEEGDEEDDDDGDDDDDEEDF